MKNLFLALIFSLSLAASASASSHSFDKCDVVGSYINIAQVDVGPPIGIGNFLSQLQLHADGTAWLWSSAAFTYPITTGQEIPFIGTWQLKKDTIIATFISALAEPVTSEDCCDVNVTLWERVTVEYRVVNKNTIERVNSVEHDFALTDNPLGPNGVIFPNPNAQQVRVYNKIPVIPSDLN